MKRLFLCTILLVFLVGIVKTNAEGKQEEKEETIFPSRKITFIVPYNVGGATDVYVRMVAAEVEKIVAVGVTVNNITGGQSVPAFAALQSEPSDGHTIIAISDSDLINTVLGRYDYRELTPVCIAQRDQSAFWVPSDSRYEDLRDLLSDAKTRPGQQVWTGGMQYDQLAVSIFTAAAGIDVQYVPHKKSSQSNSQLAGGFYDVGHEELGPMLSLYESGKVRPLCVCSEDRLPNYPEIPTAKDFDIEVTLGRWRGFGVKAGTSPEVVARLEELIQGALNSSAYKDLAKRTVTDQRPGFTSSEETKKQMDEQFEQYSIIMKQLGMIN